MKKMKAKGIASFMPYEDMDEMAEVKKSKKKVMPKSIGSLGDKMAKPRMDRKRV